MSSTVAGSSVTLMGAVGWISGQNLDRIKQAQCDNAEAMPTKTVHATEFALFDRPLPRPVDIMRLLAKGGLPLTMARSVVERIATRNIKARYYHESNRVYIEIAPEPSAETREAANGLNVDLDADGNVIGFDIDNASRLGALLRDFIASGATVEDLARAWASPHDTREEFNKEKGLTGSEAARGNDLGYLGDIEEILQRAAKYARERKFASPSSPADL
jgi:uncharacterized protein YuzE